jgi:hypothetical protein
MGSACSDRMLPQPLTIATSRRTDFEVEANSINVTLHSKSLHLTSLHSTSLHSIACLL